MLPKTLASKSSAPRHLLTAALLGLTLLSLGTPAQAYDKGDWVLGRYKNGQFWYPGVVEVDRGKGVTVAYDDGDRETLSANQVKDYDWRVGSVVECRWKSGAKWYRGKITALSDDRLSIAYDDGDREKTKTGMCRSE